MMDIFPDFSTFSYKMTGIMKRYTRFRNTVLCGGKGKKRDKTRWIFRGSQIGFLWKSRWMTELFHSFHRFFHRAFAA